MSRLEEIKKRFYEDCTEDITELYRFLNEMIGRYEECSVDATNLYKENQRYKQALEMYADIDNYVGDIQWIVVDQGETARKALEESE